MKRSLAMKLYEMQYCDDRIEEILRDLRKSNSNYSAYCKTEDELFFRIKEIISKREGVFITDAERERITDLIEQQHHIDPIVYRELYRQGYLDHMKLALSLVK